MATQTTPQQAQTDSDPLPQASSSKEQESTEVKDIIRERFEKEAQLPIAINGADPEQIDKVKAEIEEYKQNINKMLDEFE
ncbi:16319_t:CDS:2, partial [Racocetra fulgida]